MSITDPAEAYFKDGVWGFDGTVWRKLAMLWGYSDRWAEDKVNLDADAGWNNLDSSVVPDGEVWVLQAMSAYNMITSTTTEFRVKASTIVVRLARFPPPGVAVALCKCPIGVVLRSGDFARVSFLNCAAGDGIYAQFWGYKMGVAD